MKRNKDKKPEMQIRAATLGERAATITASPMSVSVPVAYGYFNDNSILGNPRSHRYRSTSPARRMGSLLDRPPRRGDGCPEIDAAARKLGGRLSPARAGIATRMRPRAAESQRWFVVPIPQLRSGRRARWSPGGAGEIVDAVRGEL